mgnify:CR=1 FL=1
MKKIFTLLIFFGSISVVSETSEQYIHRSEFFFCNFNDGKDYNDLLEEQASYEDFLMENDLQYNRINLLPIWDNDAEYDYIMWGNWPSGQDQYTEWGAYMNDYPKWSKENDLPPQNVGDCEKVEAGSSLFQWDPYTDVILARQTGIVELKDFIENETYQVESVEGGKKQMVIVESKNRNLSPHVEIIDEDGAILAGGTILAYYAKQ